jgi:ABC-2 type transport system permease protein
VPATTVFAVRGIAVGLGAAAIPGLVWIPVANMGPFAGRWELLAVYPVLLATALGAAAVALAATLGLVRGLGLRRARVAAQVLGALVGASLLIVMQLPQFVDRETQASLREAVRHSALVAMLAGPESPLGWPIRAMAGQPGPLAAVLALGIGSFVLVVRLTAGSFIAAVQQVPESPAAKRGGKAAPFRAFRTGLVRVMLAKELRLIARDPALLGMTLLQVLYLVPLFLILMRNHDMERVLAVSLVALATNLAGSFGWLAISGEEAPDLLGAAPIAPARVYLAKVAAALLPVGFVVLPFLAWYALRSPALAALVASFIAAGCASSAVVQVALGKPGGKRDLKRRKQDVGANLLEAAGTFAWAGALWLVLAGSAWALAPAAIGLLVPLCAIAIRRYR